MTVNYLSWNSCRLTALSRLLVIAACVVLTGACRRANSAEALFRDALEAMEQAIEDRDINEFMETISESYQDAQGRSRKDIRRIAQLHALRNRNLHIYRYATQMLVVDEQYANTVIFVALAGQPIESVESLASMRAELMRFEVSFEFGEKWQVVSAQWKRAGINDFLSEIIGFVLQNIDFAALLIRIAVKVKSSGQIPKNRVAL